MTTWITICDTCKRDDWQPEAGRQTDGTALASLVEAAARRHEGVRTRRTSCLMGCTHGCNITVQAAGKLCYTLGNFAPDEAAAQAIVDYAVLHEGSASGQVPYREWPAAIKGHFVTRHPPLPPDE